MILRALLDTPVNNDVPRYYKLRVIDWIVSLDEDGEILGCEKVTNKNEPFTLCLPNIGRSRDIVAKIASDKVSYVFPPSISGEKNSQRHDAFLELLAECLEQTKMREIEAIQNALGDPNLKEKLDIGKNLKKDMVIAFRVNSEIVGMQPEIVSFWEQYVSAKMGRSHDRKKDDVTLSCLVCGQTMDRISDKYIFQGTAPMNSRKPQDSGTATQIAFVPADKDAEYAFSYGLVRGENSPICIVCSDDITRQYEAVRTVRRVRLGNFDYLILGKNAEDAQEAFDFFTAPSPDAVQNMFNLRERAKGGLLIADLDDTYYLMYVSAVSVGRGHYFGHAYHLNETCDHIAEFFESQKIGNNKQYFSVPNLLKELYRRDPKSGFYDEKAIIPRLLDTTFRAILDGRPLPYQILPMAVERNRREQRITTRRAILIRKVLLQRKGVNPLEENQGFVLGRMFALINHAQAEAIEEVNAPIAGRFWAGASTAPMAVFPRLMSNYNQYVLKLEKWPQKKGKAVHFQKTMRELTEQLGNRFPVRMALEDQASFSLGFYHQETIRYTKKDDRGNTDDANTQNEGMKA